MKKNNNVYSCLILLFPLILFIGGMLSGYNKDSWGVFFLLWVIYCAFCLVIPIIMNQSMLRWGLLVIAIVIISVTVLQLFVTCPLHDKNLPNHSPDSISIEKITQIMSSGRLSTEYQKSTDYKIFFCKSLFYGAAFSYIICMISVAISIIFVFIAILSFILQVSQNRLYRIIQYLISNITQAFESVPGLIIIAILLPIISQLLHNAFKFDNYMLFIVTGLLIGFSCAPFTFRITREQISFFYQQDFVQCEKSHGAGDLRIILYHIVWKNVLPIILIELIYIFIFSIILDTGICILFTRNDISIPIEGNIHYSMGYLLTSIESQLFITKFLSDSNKLNYIYEHFLPFLRFIYPFIYILLFTSGLYLTQKGLEKRNE